MGENSETRALSREEASTLPAGAEHYAAYVGPPDQFDFMGATQFRLLTTLGLREHHSVFDFGCGSLRAGRLLIPYLSPGRYFGLDPNRWLIEDGIDRELGFDVVRIKRPTFRHDTGFSAAVFDVSFDYILAQSIFSHSGHDIIAGALASFKRRLNPAGLIAATFVEPHQLPGKEAYRGDGWVYPGCVSYERDTVQTFIADAGLVGRPIPWFHPRQTWYVMAHSAEELPAACDDIHLSGVTLRAPSLR